MDGARLQPRQPIAKIGEHTADVLRGLGYDEAQITALGGGVAQAPQEAA
jgi:crotonobetainyl-CoA:carnitine CoA-transferase CaiB-like acyl-CoA transferase